MKSHDVILNSSLQEILFKAAGTMQQIFHSENVQKNLLKSACEEVTP